jgi:hypothetical protein
MIYVFTGPTLSPEEGRRELDAVFLPPAAQGDVYRAALERPEAIGLIDGYFECVPSVWHKELLWAMAEGIPVFGAASMGALRAAELAVFGMRGVGAIFESFQHGDLEDDDEVAIVHAPPEEGFRPLSEAMVNIRATLRAAERAGVLEAWAREALERLAKALYYPERTWPALLARAGREGVAPGAVARLRDWLPRGREDQKRADALALLRAMREHLASGAGPHQASFVFAHTDAWELACRSAGRLREGAGARASLPPGALLEELRVSGLLPRVRDGALARGLALEEARRQGYSVELEGIQEACEVLRREHGLLDQQQLARWLVGQGIEDAGRFFQDEAQVRRMGTLLESDLEQWLPDHLRSLGLYGALAARMARKAQWLAEAGLERPGLEAAGVDEAGLWHWFFTERLGRPVPSDIGHHARGLGLPDVDALRREVLREYCFLQRQAGEAPVQPGGVQSSDP